MLTNLSDAARAVKGYKSDVMKRIGDVLAQGILEEFEQLLFETPQWTGTTAASWNLSMGGDHSVREQPEQTRAQALSKGHTTAVLIAMEHNERNLQNISTEYRYKDIVVENHAKGAETAENGKLREINRPGQAFERFKGRIDARLWEDISMSL